MRCERDGPRLEGRQAILGGSGRMALAILKGAEPDAIPVKRESSNRYMFDARELLHWNISESALPPGSILIEKSNSFYDRHTLAIWLTLLLLIPSARATAIPLVVSSGSFGIKTPWKS